MRKLRSVVVGVGFIGRAHVEALRRLGNVEVAAISDPVSPGEKAKACYVEKGYGDYGAMLDEIRPDVVHICAPNDLHHEIALAAIERGMHVVCEKPVAATVEQAEEMEAASRKKGVVAAVNYHNRFYPMLNHCRSLAGNGDLGRLTALHGYYMQDWLLYQTDFNWRVLADRGGKTRAVSDIGTHWLDAAEYISGQRIVELCAEFETVHPVRYRSPRPSETYSEGMSEASEEVAVRTEDMAHILFRTGGGILGSLMVSQVYAGKTNSMNIKLSGTKMSAEWDSEQLHILQLGKRGSPNRILEKDTALVCRESGRMFDYPPGHMEGFPDAIKAGFREIYGVIASGGRGCFATFADGLRTMLLCDKIYESAEKRAWVTI